MENKNEFSSSPVTIKNLSYSYLTNDYVLSNINFTLKPGTVNGLIGPSGSGKTTLLNIISGEYKLQHGAIKLGDHCLSNSARKKLTSYITMNDPLPEFDTCLEALTFYREFQNSSEEKKIEFADTDDMFSLKSSKLLNELSEGERKILSIKLHLTDRPILLLDEPFSSLDPLSTVKILKIIRELKLTTIISLHQCNEFLVSQLDSVVVLNNGTLAFHFQTVNELQEEINKLGEFARTEDELKGTKLDKIYDLFLSTLPKLKSYHTEPKQSEKITFETSIKVKTNLPFKTTFKMLTKRKLRGTYRNRGFFFNFILSMLLLPLSYCYYIKVHSDWPVFQIDTNFLFLLTFFISSSIFSCLGFKNNINLFLKDYRCAYYRPIDFFTSTCCFDLAGTSISYILGVSMIFMLTKSFDFYLLISGLFVSFSGVLIGYLDVIGGVIVQIPTVCLLLFTAQTSPLSLSLKAMDSPIYYLYLLIWIILVGLIDFGLLFYKAFF